MKVVIAGGGRVGSALAERLLSEGHSVSVVERERSVCDRVFEDLGVTAVCGDATDPRVLDDAGIGGADVAAGVLARDADNMAFAMVARAVSSARVMVRMLDPNYREAYRLAGIRDVVAEAEVVVAKIATAIEFPEVVGSLPLATGDVILFELTIEEHTEVASKTVAQVRAEPNFPRDCVFIGLLSPDGHVELPTGSTVLVPHHTAILVARREQLAEAVEYLSARRSAGGAVASVAEALRRIDFLSPLSDEELAIVSRGVDLSRVPPGGTIFQRNEPGESFFLVLSGEVALTDEANAVVEVIKTGEFFGEVSLLTGEVRSLTATARSECELAAIGQEDFRGVLMANPAVALEMSRLLGQRLATAGRAEAARKKRGLFGR